MATLTPVAPARAANQFAGQAAAAGGDDFVNDGKKVLVIENDDVDSMDLTITTTKTVDGEAVADKTITIPAGERHLIGPFPPEVYNDGDGKVALAYTDETSVTVALADCAAV